MKLIEIRLNNWCQYEGSQNFDFGDSSDKNVILIHADNDIGKSSLFYSIAWCLHEIQPTKWATNGWPLYPLPLFHKMSNGDEIKTQVEVKFEHKSIYYSAVRSFVTQKTQKGPVYVNKRFILQRQNATGNWIDEAEEKLNRIFPKSVVGYFLFDAEKIEHFINQSDSVRESVLRLLDIEDAERALTHLQKVSDNLLRQIKNKSGGSVTYLEDQLRDVQSKIEKNKDVLNNKDSGYKAQLQILRDQRKDIEAQLYTFREIHSLLEDEKSIENSIEKNKTETVDISKKLKGVTSNLYIALAQPVTVKAFNILEDKRKKGELPKHVKRVFVDERINMGLCICGTHLLPNEEPYKAICTFRETLSDALSDMSLSLGNGLTANMEKAKSLKEQLTFLMTRLSTLSLEKREHEKKLKDVRSKIQSRKDIPDIPQLQNRKEALENQESALIKTISLTESEIRTDEARQEELSIKLRVELKGQKAADKASRMWSLASAAQETLNKAIDNYKARARKYLEQQCNLNGAQLFWREGVYTMHIDSDYMISVTSPEYGDKNLLAGMSMGITQMAGLALIAALARQTQAQAPLIMDTPFARLGPAHITRALSECPKHFQQWILFLQPSEWKDDEYRKVLSGKIQKEFTLKRDSNMVTSAVEGYHRQFFGKVIGG